MKDTSISLPHTVVCMTTCWYSLSENSSYTLSKLSPHTAPVLYPPPSPPPWKNAVYLSCDSPNTSRRFVLGASNACVVGENPTCSVPA